MVFICHIFNNILFSAINYFNFCYIFLKTLLLLKNIIYICCVINKLIIKNMSDNNNAFRFSLYQGNVLLCEKIFDADVFNPFTRYSIDIRDILPKAISKLQKVLSKKKYDVIAEVGREDINVDNSPNIYYDLYYYQQNLINSFPEEDRNDIRYNPQTRVQHIEEKTIRGVECKMGLYINQNPIVERLFYVDGFNPVARYSVDVVDTVVEITDSIFDRIKKNDIKNMWNDYDLINTCGLTIDQIRQLSVPKREEMIRRMTRV